MTFMILLAHIVVAMAGLISSTLLFFKPSTRALNTTYTLTALTLLSGTFLVLSTGSHLLQACLSGLMYLGAVSVGIVAGHLKLAAAKKRID